MSAVLKKVKSLKIYGTIALDYRQFFLPEVLSESEARIIAEKQSKRLKNARVTLVHHKTFYSVCRFTPTSVDVTCTDSQKISVPLNNHNPVVWNNLPDSPFSG